MHKHIPATPLNSYVESILYLEGNNKGSGLPKTAMSMVFNLGDSFKLYSDTTFTQYTDYKKYWLAGFQLQPRYVESYGHSRMLIIQFKTLGAFSFFKEPLHYFTDQYTLLDDIDHRFAEETWQKLQENTAIPDKFTIAEQYLMSRLSTIKHTDNRLIASINQIIKTNSELRISAICREYRISRKHLNELYKKSIGISPKHMSILYRFQHSLHKLSNTTHGSLTDFAYEMDYFDQAHFCNDFKRLSNYKPSEYIRLKEYIQSLKILPHFIPTID